MVVVLTIEEIRDVMVDLCDDLWGPLTYLLL